MHLAYRKLYSRLACLAACAAMFFVATDVGGQDIGGGGYLTSTYASSWNGGGWNNPSWPGTSGNPGTGRSWALGVTGRNMDVGVVIDSVTPNSAAARLGITPGDTVVCVDGNQVGLVGSKIFDISEEINNHADASGRVRMVVQYSQSRQLRSVIAQLDSRQGGLSGTLIVRNGSIPANSIVTVQLENATRPFFTIRNGQQTFRAPSYSQGSLPFTINYDPRYISGSDRYVLRAYVTYNGSTIYETAQPTYVLTQGSPSTAQLVLTPKSFPFAGQPAGQPAGGVVAASYGSYDNITSRVTTAYERYLGRQPTAMEIAAWHSVPDPQYRMDRLSLDLLATQEYFDRCGNNNVAWIERVFTEIIGHVPSSYEQQQWMARFAELRYSRTEVLNQMALVAGRR